MNFSAFYRGSIGPSLIFSAKLWAIAYCYRHAVISQGREIRVN